MSTLVVLLLLPALALGHSCTSFTVNSTTEREDFLAMDTSFVPQSIKDVVSADTEMDQSFTGFYDCHNMAGDYEVGVAYICDESETCSCTALYQFEECSSCTVCGEIGKLESFSADCSNVKIGYTDNCTVECGYETTGCFVEEDAEETAATADNSTATTEVPSTSDATTTNDASSSFMPRMASSLILLIGTLVVFA
ncbi:expressed unknown protein [Seminavis robusta]|uniref:Uncharacterized protein n=1 Tax=Seminavis robusta TaxID=568900 RepID=A0A9N8DJV6_9STRA|nr:expressed unknown protein [Seminavis robusta]|eukprot:Sro181_g079160.1 n/a (196) ;mRNA; f:75746-76458